MLALWFIGALLVAAGVVYTAWATLGRGRMSDPGPNPEDTGRTLEPRHRGLRFLGLGANWPGILMILLGALMLLLPLFVASPPQP